MKKGTEVQLIQPTIAGSIVSTRYNEETESLEHLVEWVNDQNETNQRWFAEADLEEV